MSVVVVGSTGWLGEAISAQLDEPFPIAAHEVLRLGWRRSFETAGIRRAEVDAIVNAAGLRAGQPLALSRANVALAEMLADAADELGIHLVHLGSAAEYGLVPGRVVVSETDEPQPQNDYGRSKLAGTKAAMRAQRSCVLRVFNAVDSPPQAGSPIADIWGRIERGIAAQESIEVLSGGTVRDYVSRSFIAASVTMAIRTSTTGLFNVCSGTGVSVADLATAVVLLSGSTSAVEDLEVFPASAIVGNPEAWFEAAGLRETLDARSLAGLLMQSDEKQGVWAGNPPSVEGDGRGFRGSTA